jgi:tetratricopeptide (TPR) repeat protein
LPHFGLECGVNVRPKSCRTLVSTTPGHHIVRKTLAALALICAMPGAALAEDLTHCKAAVPLMAKEPAKAKTELKLCQTTGQLTPRSQILTHMNLAVIASLAGKWAEVLSEYDTAERLTKTAGLKFDASAPTLYNRGVAFMETNQPKKARADLDAAVLLAPKNMQLRAAHIELLMRSHDFQGAVKDAGVLIASGVPRWMFVGYLDRGAANQELGKFQDALADADAAIKLDPKEPLALNNRCMAAATLARKDAIASCQAAIDIAPKVPTFWNSMGFAQEKAGNLKEAETWYAKAAAAAPKNAENNAALARVRAAQGTAPTTPALPVTPAPSAPN